MKEFRPKWEEAYWYIGQNDANKWTFMQKACVNDWLDKYHISMGNCYRTEEEAKEDVYDMLEKITGENGYTVWLRDGVKEGMFLGRSEEW